MNEGSIDLNSVYSTKRILENTQKSTDTISRLFIDFCKENDYNGDIHQYPPPQADKYSFKSEEEKKTKLESYKKRTYIDLDLEDVAIAFFNSMFEKKNGKGHINLGTFNSYIKSFQRLLTENQIELNLI